MKRTRTSSQGPSQDSVFHCLYLKSPASHRRYFGSGRISRAASANVVVVIVAFGLETGAPEGRRGREKAPAGKADFMVVVVVVVVVLVTIEGPAAGSLSLTNSSSRLARKVSSSCCSSANACARNSRRVGIGGDGGGGGCKGAAFFFLPEGGRDTEAKRTHFLSFLVSRCAFASKPNGALTIVVACKSQHAI